MESISARGASQVSTNVSHGGQPPGETFTHQPKTKTVGVIGAAGAIGASLLLAATTAQPSSKYDVYGVFRPQSVAHYQQTGLSVTKGDQTTVILPSSHPATSGAAIRFVGSLNEVPAGAVVFNAVKNNQLDGSLSGLSSKHKLVLMQNGLGHVDKVKADHPGVPVYTGISYVAGNKKPEGGVETKGGFIQVGGDTELVGQIQESLGPQNIFDVKVESDMTAASWRKAALNSALNPLATIFRSTFSGVIGNHRMQTLVKKVIAEVCTVGEAAGVFKPGQASREAEGVYQKFEFAAGKFPNHPSSMQLAFKAGEATEVPALNQYVSEKGKELGIKTPLNTWITTYMQDFEAKRKQCASPEEFYARHGEEMKQAATRLAAMAQQV